MQDLSFLFLKPYKGLHKRHVNIVMGKEVKDVNVLFDRAYIKKQP